MASDAGAAGAAGRDRCPTGIDGAKEVDGRPTRRTRARQPATSTSCSADGDGPQAGVQRRQRLRPLPARRQRRHVRVLAVELRRLRQRRAGPVLRRADGHVVRDADGTPAIGRAPPARHRDDHHRPLPLPLRRPLADDRRAASPDDGGNDLRPRPRRPLEGARVPQDPGSNTPCCGYEEEDTNWGGSSTLLGERVGPVRAIRETWGADSGTNVIRRETFYRDEMRQKTWLRVHVIPPLDGIYAQWDFNAGADDHVLQPAQRRRRADRRPERRGVRQPRRPVQPATTTATTPAHARPGLPARCTSS